MKRRTTFFVCALLLAVVARAQWTPDANKRYLLKHVNSGHFLYLHDNYAETNAVNATSLRQVGTAFTVTKNGSNYTFTKAGTSKTLGCANGSWSGWNTSNSVATAWQFVDAGNGAYYIKSAKGFLGPNQGSNNIGAHIYTDKQKQQYTKWLVVEENAVAVTPTDGKVYALYNANTNGNYPVTAQATIASSTTATPQLYVLRANGTDNKGTTVFRLQKAEFDGNYLAWTNNAPKSVTHSTGTSNFLFLNNASSGYSWQSGTAPVDPLVNFMGYAGGQYTIFGDQKTTNNAGFDGYSRRTANTLLSNAQCAKGANYSTTWKLVEQPYELYNVVITGNAPSTNPTVTYNNAWDNAIQRTPQGNGGSILIGYDARSLSPNHFTAEELDGNILQSIAINGKTITVTYKSEVSLTYIYKYGNTEWFRETYTMAPGSAYPDLKTPPAGVKYTTIPYGKLQGDVTFVVNCEITPNYRIVPSENFENANWVYLSIVDNYGNAKFLRYDANTPNKIHSTDDQPTADPSFKWAFVGSPFTGYKIYNQATGSTKIMTSTNPNGDGNTGGNTFIHMETETADMEANGFNTYWTFANNSLGILLSRKGQSIYANNRNGTFAFWTGGNDAGSRMFAVPIANQQPATSLVDSKGQNVVGNKQYRLINRNSGIALTGNAGSYLGRSGRNNNANQLWTLTADGNGFEIKNATNAYLTGGPTSQKWASTADASSNPKTMYLYAGNVVNGVQYYYINDMSALSDATASLRHFVGDDGEYIRSRGSMAGSHMEWYLEDATPTAAPTVTYATNITSGGYYRLVSNSYNKVMTDNGGGIGIAGKGNDNYAQIWQVTGSNGNYTFKNLATGKYIQGWPGQSQQWRTGDNAANFYSGTTDSGENKLFWFAVVNNMNEHKSLHAAGASNQNNTVVGWQASSDASKWLLEPVNVTTEMESAAVNLRMITGNDYTNQLANFFTDHACTQLKSNYASMSDAQLRSAMSNLPEMLREEAVRVKNNKWNDNAQWNYFEKDFRIHDYESYSATGPWSGKLGFGDFGRLSQPTGIRLKAGEVACILVNDDVADSDGKLWVEMPVATNNTGGQKALKKGYNFVKPGEDCELFITYQNTNTEKPLSAYPDIKIHIVGGTCNGAFDMSRGHTNNDWMWLKENMFKDQYLHLKSNYHVFCTYLNNMRPAQKLTRGMQMIDFVFEAEDKAMSSRFNDGYYRPMITVWDKGSGNPSAGNGRVSWPGIRPDLFDETSFRNGDWTTSWAYPHEVGHLHQRPLWLAGTREGSNEVLLQIYTHLWGKKTARGAQTILASRFNKEGGTGWVDNLKNGGYIQEFTQKMWFQLWLYFHQKGDNEFFSRWMEAIHRRGNLQNRWYSNENPAGIEKDYMRVALAACEASQTDLYEFFKVWGFFNYAENYNNVTEQGVVSIGDYESFFLKVPRKSVPAEVAQMEAWKAEMQSYPNKAPGVMFINETAEERYIEADAEVLKYFPELAGTKVVNQGAGADVGCTGFFTHYGVNEADNLGFELNGNTITITGSGAVGFKIYDNTGELIWISYWKNFNVTEAIAAGIANGTYSLVASLGDDTDLLLSGPGTEYTGGANAKSFDEATGVETIDNEQSTIDNDGWYTINGVKLNGKPTEKGIYIFNGKKVVVK